MEWLKEKVGGCIPREGASLKAVEMGDLRKLARVTIFDPS